MDNFSVLRWSRTFVVACAKKTCELPVYYNTIRNFSKVQLKLCRRRTALSSLPQNPAPEPSAPPALIQNTSLRCDWFSCHLPDSGQCFQNLQWSGARLQMQAKHFAVQQLALVFQAMPNPQCEFSYWVQQSLFPLK